MIPERAYGVPHALIKGQNAGQSKPVPNHKLNPEDIHRKTPLEETKGSRKASVEETKIPAENKIQDPQAIKEPQAKREQNAKREPQAKSETQSKKAAQAQQEPEGGDPFQYLDIRVGRVERVWRHPEADRLFVEEIDLGTEKRTVVSGLVGHVTEEEFTGSHVLVLANLKKSKLKGVVSEAMVLCAKNDGKVELLKPAEGSTPGDAVTAEGVDYTPVKQLNEKKKYWETAAQSLNISEDGLARYREASLKTKSGLVTAPTLKAGTIS